ncbi:MAG TPA: universal stress protein [Pyrinomonadaceae bacterium]|nr:universal stress protein [Pyrinomonadaceae bacterium]
MKTEMLPIKKPKLAASRKNRVAKTTRNSREIKNVLVPLDFSTASHAALRFALPLLKRFGANLHLVHVLPPDSPLSGLADLPMVVPDVEIGRRVRRNMASVAEKHGGKLLPSDLHFRKGSPFAEICNLAREKDIDLVVISTRGNTGLKHLTLGSTAERVVRYSPCPVLAVRDPLQANKAERNGKTTTRRPQTITRILVPIDFSDCSLKSLAYAKQLAKEFNATVILLHSVALQYFITSDEYARYDLPLLTQQSEKIAQRQMRDLVRMTQRDGARVESSVQIGHAGQQIVARAQAEHADLIVTSTHGYTGLKHVLMGSTAEYVVRHATCPVLVVPTRERPVIS